MNPAHIKQVKMKTEPIKITRLCRKYFVSSFSFKWRRESGGRERDDDDDDSVDTGSAIILAERFVGGEYISIIFRSYI